MNKKVDLSKFSNDWYNPGNFLKRIFWYFVNCIFFNSYVLIPNFIKVFLLKIFGAKVGKNVVIKPKVNIKYPWFLEIGNYVWIGEETWIDNLTFVNIGSNVCISQGAYILTGNHNYKSESFDLIIKPVIIEDGVWIGARAIICPGIILKSHCIINVGSVITKDCQNYAIYQGNPAVSIRRREIV